MGADHYSSLLNATNAKGAKSRDRVYIDCSERAGNSVKKVAVFTSTRADFGLLKRLLQVLKRSDSFNLSLVATGMHLSSDYGNTYTEIEEAGFDIDEKISIQCSGNTAVSISKTMGKGISLFAEYFESHKPDVVILLGDRYEILAAAQAALIACIPIAHIAGGDITEGAFDNSIRHAITKMSSIHFVTNGNSKKRVQQMGENPKNIHEIGNLGLDAIQGMPFMGKNELESELGFKFRQKNILFTYHSETLDTKNIEIHTGAIFAALSRLDPKETGIIFTHPNSDTAGDIIADKIKEFTKKHPNSVAYTSLGQLKYLSVMKLVDAVVGNSSSGFYEAPFFKKPTVNIGDRQKGRDLASSIKNVSYDPELIYQAIQDSISTTINNVSNPYAKTGGPEIIHDTLKSINDFSGLTRKGFYEIK